MYGRKFAFKNRLGQPYSSQKIYRFSLFYFVFESNFQVQAPGGAYIWRGDLTERFLRYEFGGLIFEGAYIWSGLFSKFYGTSLIQTLSAGANFARIMKQRVGYAPLESLRHWNDHVKQISRTHFQRETNMLDNWISVLQAKVQDYYKQMNDMVMETYSVEDQQIIGCPSIQQVCFIAVCDSYTLKFSWREK